MQQSAHIVVAGSPCVDLIAQQSIWFPGYRVSNGGLRQVGFDGIKQLIFFCSTYGPVVCSSRRGLRGVRIVLLISVTV